MFDFTLTDAANMLAVCRHQAPRSCATSRIAGLPKSLRYAPVVLGRCLKANAQRGGGDRLDQQQARRFVQIGHDLPEQESLHSPALTQGRSA
jgi:hypothetical protein